MTHQQTGRRKLTEAQPKFIPNPLWCERCQGRGYLVADAEWEPYAVQCDDCKDRRPAITEAGRTALAENGAGQ